MVNRKAFIHCEDGNGFRVELYRGELCVMVVWCRDEASANVTAEYWERDGAVV